MFVHTHPDKHLTLSCSMGWLMWRQLISNFAVDDIFQELCIVDLGKFMFMPSGSERFSVTMVRTSSFKEIPEYLLRSFLLQLSRQSLLQYIVA